MIGRVFLDSSFAIAAAVPKDRSHARAVLLAGRIRAENLRFVTTRLVLVEIGNTLSKRSYRDAARGLLQSIESDPRVEIIPLSEELYGRAFELYKERPDKEWGLTDCVSFVAMRDLEIDEALTTDRHFEQAGFRALLREPSII